MPAGRVASGLDSYVSTRKPAIGIARVLRLAETIITKQYATGHEPALKKARRDPRRSPSHPQFNPEIQESLLKQRTERRSHIGNDLEVIGNTFQHYPGLIAVRGNASLTYWGGAGNGTFGDLQMTTLTIVGCDGELMTTDNASDVLCDMSVLPRAMQQHVITATN